MMYPGLSSWAKFSRPYGTKLVILVLTHSRAPEVRLFHRPWRAQPREEMTSPYVSRKAAKAVKGADHLRRG
jgi:hypothetical protein